MSHPTSFTSWSGPFDMHEHQGNQKDMGVESHTDNPGSIHSRTNLLLEERMSLLSSQAHETPINSHGGVILPLHGSSLPRDSRPGGIPFSSFNHIPSSVPPSTSRTYPPPSGHMAFRLEGPPSDNENAQERTRQNNKGKGRAHSGESTCHDFSVYQPNYQQQDEENSLNFQRQHQAGASSQQYLSPNWSQVGPSGGFFEGSSGIGISGGKFNQTYGHHTNVTIHVNQTEPREENDTRQQQQLHSSALLWASPSQAPGYNIVSPATQDVYRSPPMPMYEQAPSVPIHNIGSPPMRDIHHSQFTSTSIYEQGPSSSTTVYSPDNSNKIYERLLGLKQRGFPLWIPEPNRTLPMPYRRKGISVGDVGIITPFGGFSFLFNICLGNDDPINPPILPDGFAPIYPPIKPMDIREYPEFKPVSFLASAAIEKTHNDPPFRGLSFTTSSVEGAVLTLPDGAMACDLTNVRRFRAYAAANIESWYRYVNGPRGCEVKNGEIRLVVGCDKATSWGMAAVANLAQQKTHYLKYRSIEDEDATTSPIPLYKWEYTGLADARVGPDLPEIEELKRDDDSDVAVGGKYLNQCLFMRTLNPTLRDEVFEAINEELEAELIQESQQFQNRGGSDNAPNGSSNSGAQISSNVQPPETNSATQTGSTSESLESTTAQLTVVGDRVTMSRSPSAPILHPADVLNKVLLQKVPTGRVVITQDEDWSSVINKDDEIMPSPSEIAERVLAVYHIKEEDGAVFLEPKEERPLALRPQIPFNRSTQDYSISASTLKRKHVSLISETQRDGASAPQTPTPLTPARRSVSSTPRLMRRRRNFKALVLAVEEDAIIPIATLPAQAPSKRQPLTLGQGGHAPGVVLNPTLPPESPQTGRDNAIDATLSRALAKLDLQSEAVKKFSLKNEDLKELQHLGQGKSGNVVEVEHIPTGTIMAKKGIFIDAKPSVRKQIIRELLFMHELHSQYIVSCFGAFPADSHIYICMEFMDKGSFDSIYKKIGAIDIDAVCLVANSVLEGLNYLYDVHHIIHRDIKPSNILLNSEGNIKLCDFGVSGELVNSIADSFVGTSVYISPERIQGVEYSVKSDIWSVGISLIELATGRFPFSESLQDDDGPFVSGDSNDDAPGLVDFSPDFKEKTSTHHDITFAFNKRQQKQTSKRANTLLRHKPMSIIELMHHIVGEPAPRLSASFSEESKEFIDACLMKDPDERPSLKALLEYRWMDEARNSDFNLRAWATTF